jgi:G3E family GTPase
MIPVSVITGFLGSGKTTLLNRLLQHDGLRNSLVIINEFGEVGLDHLLVSAPSENLRLLENGCLCCEMRGDLIETLTDVAIKRARGEIPAFDRILVETTGLADPVPIVQTVVTDKELGLLFTLDSVVAVVDAAHVLSQLDVQDEIRKQIAVADVLLLSKTDLVDDEVVAAVEAAARAINPGAEIIQVLHGIVDPKLLFGRSGERTARDIARWLAPDDRGDGERTYRLHTAEMKTFTLYRDAPVTLPGLATWLSMLAGYKGAHLLRVKGIVNVDGEPHVIHAVQTIVHEPEALERWPSDDRRTRIVFIVREIERADIERTFTAFDMPASLGKGLEIDPAVYEQFVNAARNFIPPR